MEAFTLSDDGRSWFGMSTAVGEDIPLTCNGRTGIGCPASTFPFSTAPVPVTPRHVTRMHALQHATRKNTPGTQRSSHRTQTHSTPSHAQPHQHNLIFTNTPLRQHIPPADSCRCLSSSPCSAPTRRSPLCVDSSRMGSSRVSTCTPGVGVICFPAQTRT